MFSLTGCALISEADIGGRLPKVVGMSSLGSVASTSPCPTEGRYASYPPQNADFPPLAALEHPRVPRGSLWTMPTELHPDIPLHSTTILARLSSRAYRRGSSLASFVWPFSRVLLFALPESSPISVALPGPVTRGEERMTAVDCRGALGMNACRRAKERGHCSCVYSHCF